MQRKQKGKSKVQNVKMCPEVNFPRCACEANRLKFQQARLHTTWFLRQLVPVRLRSVWRKQNIQSWARPWNHVSTSSLGQVQVFLPPEQCQRPAPVCCQMYLMEQWIQGTMTPLDSLLESQLASAVFRARASVPSRRSLSLPDHVQSSQLSHLSFTEQWTSPPSSVLFLDLHKKHLLKFLVGQQIPTGALDKKISRDSQWCYASAKTRA